MDNQEQRERRARRVVRSEGERTEKRRMSTAAKVLIIILVVLLLAVAGVGVYYIGILNNPGNAFGDSESVSVDEEGNLTGKLNILFLGIDSNKAREKKNMGWRSDVMMLCTLDFDKDTMDLLSVPRDMWVDVPRAMDDNGNVTESAPQRINTAYSFGGGPNKDGAKFAVKCMEDFLSMNGEFDVKIDYFVSLDIDGMLRLAEDIGGVDVVLDRDVKGVGSEGETVTITKDNIDAYIRTRKGAGDDYGRASRQQDYIMAIAKKVKKMGTADAVSKLYGTIVEYAKTDMSLEKCIAVANYLKKDFDLENMNKHMITGTGFRTETGAAVLAVNEDELREYMKERF